ncbi:armadillo-type protein [Zychaea mexicana]|uniref:armadillo-type protein n=1 Tax=Zychaea mexicana TaxID=64656 RepID=UPI0022FE2B71|nr:armadillo-type protein [Zychaea mexicana]KAI9492847.1 armadillo-type protein [Zychaea mexicana]
MSYYQRSRQEGGHRYGRSGGGGGSYNDRRYNRDDRRGGGGYRRNRAPSPSRDDEAEDIEVRLRGLIIKIGDKFSSDLRINLNKMKNILDNDYAKYPDTVKDTLKACVSELPAKAPVYGTLFGLLNLSSHELVGKLMYEVNDMLKQAVADADWFKFKQLLRFYGELVNANVILPTSYCDLISTILSALDESNQPRRRLDCIIYVILSTLPWSGKELSERNGGQLDEILNRIESYMNRRGEIPNRDILRRYRSGSHDDKQRDELMHLWSLVKELRDKGWDVPLLPKPYQWFDKEFSSTLQHDIPSIETPKHTDSVAYIKPSRPLRVNVDESGKSLPNVPDHDGLEYFILQDIIMDTIHIFESNRKECSKYLLAIGNNFEPGKFGSNTQQQDSENDRMEEDQAGWNLADVLIENIFSQMLDVPSAPYREVFYTCVLAELCRADSASFPMALGRAVKVIFDNIEDMDTACIYRFSPWFAHHLSNFGFQWDWAAWQSSLSLDPAHPKVCFIRETLEKDIRLSYYERIKSTVPEPFHALIPSQPPGPDFEYENGDHPLHDSAKEVINGMKSKKSSDDIQAILERFKEEQGSQGADGQEQTKLTHELFVQAMLLVGSKSFSHVLNVVERYLEVLRFVNATPEARVHTVHVVATFWKHNSQFLGILLDKLLNYRVIDPSSVIIWAFEKQQLEHAERAFVWEILQNTLNKVVTRVAQVKSKLESCQQMHTENEAKRANETLTEMAQAEAQQELDTLRLMENSLSTVTREQKEVFIVAYQKFVQVLQERLTSSTSGPDVELTWTYRWIFGWYREIMRLYHKECSGFLTTMETVVFTDDIDERIKAVFADIKGIHQDETSVVV